MATTEADIQSALSKGCASLKGAVDTLKQTIETETGILQYLATQLQSLESQPNPDRDQIRKISQQMDTLRERVAADYANLESAQNDYEANCGSSQSGGHQT